MIEHLFRSRSDFDFRVRSKDRDADADNKAIMSIAGAIEEALAKAEKEQAGLKLRIDDVVSRAAIVAGNDIDDYVTRTEDRSKMLTNSEAEIRYGEDRLRVLGRNIEHFRFLKASLESCFPDPKMRA